MGTRIRTNRVVYDFNYEEIVKLYDVIEVKTTDLHFKSGSYLLDKPLLNNNIKSIKFEKGNKFYVLMDKESNCISSLKVILEGEDEADRITLEMIDPRKIDKRILAQLFLNAIGNYETDILRFNNLTGHLYCVHPDWIEKSKSTNEIFKVSTLELNIDDNDCLSLNVRTFTSSLLKKIKFTKKKFEDYPQYIIDGNNILRRKLREDSQQGFIMRQTEGDKTKDKPFLNITDYNKFRSSKMGIMADVIETFNKKYQGVVRLGFDEVEVSQSIDFRKNTKKEKELIADILAQAPLHIVDMIQDQYSENLCNDIVKMIKDEYGNGVNVSVGKRVKKEAFNLMLIHEDSYYGDGEDPYDKKYDGIAIQHLTFENFKSAGVSALNTVIHEIIIKKDLIDKTISMFDWITMGLEEAVEFGTKYVDENEEQHFTFMKILPDGRFEISEQELDLFSYNEYYELMSIYDEAETAGEHIKGIIRFGENQINVIKDTGNYTLPMFELIKEEYITNGTISRSAEERGRLLASCLDIKAFESDNSIFYFAGLIGYGMNRSIPCAANIRTVEGYNGADNIFMKLLPLMAVDFVKNGQLTVVPFPFKYLNEFIKEKYR